MQGYEIVVEEPVCSMAAWRSTSLHPRLTMNRPELEKVSKALADKTRLRIFEAISATGRMNCGDIVSMRGVTPRLSLTISKFSARQN
jgi:hypothetical protein